MRRFSSYGPVDKDIHYYVPRQELIEKGYTLLLGESPEEGGHYLTVWAPRQRGKTWIMQEAIDHIKQINQFDVVMTSVGRAKEQEKEEEVMKIIIEEFQYALNRTFPPLKKISELRRLFTGDYFKRPVILVLDEFDALDEVFINQFSNVFRELYLKRTIEKEKTNEEKTCLLHGLALIGVRSVLGIENQSGSPFNVQRSLHIPNLTIDEVREMFQWYERESGQEVEPEVIDRLYKETNGQPGITCWFGELLTEAYNPDPSSPITLSHFDEAYGAATHILPNNNILNLISKVNKPPYNELILELFKTGEKIEFKFHNRDINYLYMNGIIDSEKGDKNTYYLKFSSPFVQKSLFDYFSETYFKFHGNLVEPFTNLDSIITPSGLEIIPLLNLYQAYLDRNKTWLFKNAPRRSDQRIFEAVFHFSFFSYVSEFSRSKNIGVIPEFPTGNGKIDILLQYKEMRYGIELKSFRDNAAFRDALDKAAQYGKQLGLNEIYLVNFIESIDESTRTTYQEPHQNPVTGVIVNPFFIITGDI